MASYTLKGKEVRVLVMPLLFSGRFWPWIGVVAVVGKGSLGTAMGGRHCEECCEANFLDFGSHGKDGGIKFGALLFLGKCRKGQEGIPMKGKKNISGPPKRHEALQTEAAF